MKFALVPTRKLLTLLAVCGATLFALPGLADAEWVVKGRGFGHGIGMSQYGAYGFAQHGRTYEQILSHYYRHTDLLKTKSKPIRVLLDAGLASAPFHGATAACGQKLRSTSSYYFALSAGKVKLHDANGKQLANCGREGSASGGKSVYSKNTPYRGEILGRRVGSSLFAINRLSIDDYVKGVVPNEMPASWDAEALKSQAVAARSYGLATTVSGNGYDVYKDTRSQVYGGLSTEQPAGNAAVEATARQVLEYGGEPIVAFFSSTSGGRTENVEFGFPGAAPQPYLKSANDPYDKISPYAKWTVNLSNASMSSKLGGLYEGTLKRIKILETGVSPRIVEAKVIGSKGSSNVSGPTLEYRLGLRSSWATFEKK
ncbi:hypothetical protein BH10ACT11_BH10ACT11_01730 [soil metagenome]